MSSHISHYLFSRDSIIETFKNLSLDIPSFPLTDTNPKDQAIFVGSQGPDIFFHNQRTMPSGLQIGAVMHRNGYGSFSAYLIEHCLEKDYAIDSQEFLFVLAFISHAIMDRYFHPYINYFSGWVELKDEESHKYRHCHSFFERIIDVVLLHKIDNANIRDINYAGKFDLGSQLPETVEQLFLYGLSNTYKKLAQDDKKQIRLQNAYSDSRGYYWYSQNYLEQYEDHLLNGQNHHMEDRWLALLHPLALDPSIDYANDKNIRWSDPCYEEEVRTQNLMALYHEAKKETVRIFSILIGLMMGQAPPNGFTGIAPLVGNSDLRTNIPQKEPCTMQYANPLPLQNLIHRLAKGNIPEDWFYPSGENR